METQVIANSAPSTKSELPAISSYCCQTKGVVNEINFKWTIERSAFFGDLGIWETLKSAEFSDSNFFLTLDTTYDCIVRIYLDRHSNRSNYPIRVEFAISNEKDEEIGEKTATTGISKGIARSLLFQMNKKDLLESNYFVNGNITISCKIKSLIRKQLTKKVAATERHLHKTIPIRDDDQDLILHQLKESFEKMLFSDVTFNVSSRQFSAHKNILVMRRPVFAAMFQHPTKEMLSGQVKVDDIDPDVFQEVLRYLYTGSPQSTAMDVMAPALFAAADKYLLDHLKTRCETHLIRQMSSQNCLDLLALTNHHPAEYFHRYPSKFMMK
jgi:speckle-type POZ protein